MVRKIALLLLMLCLVGCGKAPQSIGADETANIAEKLSLSEVMDRILTMQSLDNAADYKTEVKDTSKDAIVLLAKNMDKRVF